MTHLSHLVNQYECSPVAQISFVFAWRPLPAPGAHVGCYVPRSRHVSSLASRLWPRLSPSLLLVTLTVLKSTSQMLCGTALIWRVAHVFLVIRLQFWVWGRRTAEMKCHSHNIASAVHRGPDLALLVWTLVSWLRKCFPGYFPVKIFSFPLFVLCILEGSHCAQLTLKLTSLKAECLHKLFRILLHGRCISSLCLLKSYRYGLTDICLVFWAVIQYCFHFVA